MQRFYSFLFAAALIASQSTSTSAQSMGAWSNTGPTTFPVNSSGQVNGIGRVSQIKFHPTNSNKVYAVSASGGVYVTSNNGVNWTVMSGTEKLPQTSSSSLCINYANDQTLYLSLGDADYYSNSYGIYKSMDGGATWNAANSGSGTAMAVEMLMDPSDTNKVVAATKNGIYRTTNGGSSWTLTQAGTFRDMKAKPVSGSKTLYAVTATAFYYSTDFGITWTQATSVVPPSGNGGMRIAVSAADTARVYLLTTGGNGQIYKSTNSGGTFTTVYSSASQCLVCYDASVTSGSQGNYDMDISANPLKANELLIAAHCVWRSTDGGATWSKRTFWYNECHTDMHQIEWNPYNNAQRWNANDGGVWMSTDTNATLWNPRSDGLAATEAYHAAQSPVIRELVSIATQDNGELYYNSTGWKTNRGGDWTTPSNMDYRSTGAVWYTATGNRRNLAPLGSDQSFNPPYNPATGTFVQNDAARVEFIKSLPLVAFIGRDSVFRCTNTGAATPAWQLILPNTGAMRDLESCRADSNILYVAVAPSTIYRSDNALSTTPTWTSYTTPASMSVTGSITTSRYNPNVVFLSCGNAVYRSINKGASWTAITGTGLSGLNIRRIICDDYSPKQRLFVSAGAYVHYKDSTSTSWTNHTATAGLPTVANATDFMIYNDGTASSILRLSTFGRGVWQCDINTNAPPSPDFTADRTIICPGDTVNFAHNVNGTFTSLSWSFTGGNISSSTALAPTVIYTTPGVYAVSLTASNSFGSNSITKTGYIVVSYGQQTPVAEGFEGATYLPAGWQADAGSNWNQTVAASGYGLSSKSIVWDNYNVDAGGARDRIIAPRVNLTGIANARLKFDVAYAPYSTGYPDTLQVRISTDCGKTWSVAYDKTGTALATAPANTSTLFVPTATQWRTDSISLAAYSGNSLMVSFDNIGHYGQALYLDNINILMSPLAAFGANDTTVCVGTPVSFGDSSLNATGWSWTFTGGTPATSTVKNPVVTYGSTGTYAVTLTASNALGNGTLTKTGYVQVYSNPVVNLGADTMLCPGASLILNAANSGASYLWNTAATTQTQAVLSAGTYLVTVTNSNGCIGRDTIIISAGSNPAVTLGNDTSLCPSVSLTLNAGNSGSTYLWNNAATSQSITATSVGTYSVRVTNAQGCIGLDTIGISALAAPVVNLGRDTVLCTGSTITLDAGNGGSSFLWSTGATTQTTIANAAGTYTVRVTNAQGCAARDTIVVSAGTTPNAPIVASGSLFTAGSTGVSYQWYRNGTLIPGATAASYPATQSGSYTVIVTNSDDCVGTSPVYVYTAATGVSTALRDAGYELYPNPSGGTFNLQGKGISAGTITLNCYDAAGRVLRSETLRVVNGAVNAAIDWSSLPRGVYAVAIGAEGGSPVRSTIVIR